MEYRSALVSSSRGQGPDFPPRPQQPLSSCSFPFVDVHNNPLGIGNIGRPVNGVDLNGLVRSPWPVSVFSGNVNSRVLTTETGNDVWDEFPSCPMEMINPQVNGSLVPPRVALEEMNMHDDLLARVGVVNGLVFQEDPIRPQPVITPMPEISEQQGDWVQLSSGFDVSQMGIPIPIPGICHASPDSMSIAAGGEKKSGLPEEIKDKTTERRQRRMIKNRESAARSRAKKQAYMHDLEKKVFYLRKMNKWLKKVRSSRCRNNKEMVSSLFR
ncbi:ABSCISIC ACID-INSENSITIVE 5-like protein 3 isoform X1 [Punica granatum]|uniref:ABSCISIC ACID-INSENSITIVE 5-like protein 3 isoform X1 n=1 Tax=Punica granatum TaxID=22663 RepID=A0A218X4J4_PUNGR|nr:ABSCISIC ACID-INSENSITIVE 5-like protein 3 isoform X1 [Punica granatum]OWM79917.1 hypothetical protein CDL15_Pgr006221 [Punica granatum]